MSRDTQEFEIRRNVYKQLKEAKVFGVFCTVVANSFWKDDQPRSRKERYLEFVENNHNMPTVVKGWVKNTCLHKKIRMQQ